MYDRASSDRKPSCQTCRKSSWRPHHSRPEGRRARLTRTRRSLLQPNAEAPPLTQALRRLRRRRRSRRRPLGGALDTVRRCWRHRCVYGQPTPGCRLLRCAGQQLGVFVHNKPILRLPLLCDRQQLSVCMHRKAVRRLVLLVVRRVFAVLAHSRLTEAAALGYRCALLNRTQLRQLCQRRSRHVRAGRRLCCAGAESGAGVTLVDTATITAAVLSSGGPRKQLGVLMHRKSCSPRHELGAFMHR